MFVSFARWKANAADSGLLLTDVLARPRFDRYISLADRQQFLGLPGHVAEFVPIVYPVRECRDPKDDKFLQVALNGKADSILTGDVELLALYAWQGTAILPPPRYFERCEDRYANRPCQSQLFDFLTLA